MNSGGPFFGGDPQPCQFCGKHCNELPEVTTASALNPRSIMVQSAHTVRAPHRIIDPELEQVIYSPGDVMTDADAVKYGVVTAEEAARGRAPVEPDPTTKIVQEASKRARKASQDRAVKPSQDRAIKPEDDRVATLDAKLIAEGPKSDVPPRSATKATWIDYAMSQGADEHEAKSLSLAQLVEKYGE